MTKKKVAPPIVQRPLLWWISLRAHRKHQILLLGIVMLTVGLRLVPLEMQKRIVDEGILGKNARLLAIYCAVYLVAFLSASALKYAINALQMIIGQRTLAQMRREMFGHILHLPYGLFRNTQSGAVVTTLLAELATAGDFIGLAVAVPATNLLTLAAFGTYLFFLNPLLAMVCFSIYPVVVAAIPFLQKRVNRYNRKRVNATRRVSGKIGEVIDGLHEIKTANAYRHEESEFRGLVDRLCRIRIAWNLYRYAVKVFNNLLVNFSRFLIFALGGYLALKGQLAIGSLVAFLSAQEKLYDPWKEMIAYYQAYQTAAVTYERAMKTYDAIPEQSQSGDESDVQRLEGDVLIDQVGFRTADGSTLLRDISLKVAAGRHLALVGASGSGKSTLAHCIVGLMPPAKGRIRIGDRDITKLTRAELSRNVAFVPQEPFVFRGTIAQNLYYPAGGHGSDPGDHDRRKRLNACIEMIQQVGFFIDVLGFGLEYSLDSKASEELKQATVAVRRRLAASLDEDLASHVERFETDRFLHHASLGENLIFGRFAGEDTFGSRQLAANRPLVELLAESGLTEPLCNLGMAILREMAPYLRRPPLPEDMQRLLPLDMKQIRIGLKLANHGNHDDSRSDLRPAEKAVLLTVALACVPGKYPGIEIPKNLQDAIVATRAGVREHADRIAPGGICFYRPDRYIENADIFSNLLFGRVRADREATREGIRQEINRALIEEELLEAIVEVGLQHQVGTAGKNLSGGQRQKLAIARALLKKPPVLVFDEATAGLDRTSQSRVQDVLVKHWKGRSTLIAVTHRLDVLPDFDEVAVLREGRLVENGTYQDLMAREGDLHSLVNEGSASRSG